MPALSRSGGWGAPVSATDAPVKGSWGGRREGAGGKPLTDEERLRRRNASEQEAGSADDPVAEIAAAIGLSPRVAKLRPELAETCEVVPPGEHFARFCATYLRHHQRVPGGPKPGSPFELVEYQREFFNEALEVDDGGSRAWSTAVMVIPRKNGKTTINSALALYFCSPADGEEMPEVILAAAAKKQAGKLYDHARAFIDHPRYAVPALRALFLAGASELRCPAMGGKIERVAGDGDNNHSLDPSAVVADELHTWSTPKQCENWRALTTADGGRLDPLVVGISTEGADDDNELARLLERVVEGDATEVEHRRPGLTIYRDRGSRILVFVYAVSSSATLADIDEFMQANPAPWRTRERVAQDLANRRNDEPTRLRLYGNRRGAGAGRWIADDKIDQLVARGSGVEIPAKAAQVVVAVDGAISRDTTACSWSWRSPGGLIVQRSRVWSCREDRPHDVFVPGGRLDNDLVRDYILENLVPAFGVELVFYDERYFETQAKDLSDQGLMCVEMHQGKTEMRAAWDEYYHDVHEGTAPTIALGGEPRSLATLRQHIRNAVGSLTDRGWYVTKKGGKNSILVIDGLASCVMGAYGVRHFTDFKPKSRRAYSW